jgi:hypothetical protein
MIYFVKICRTPLCDYVAHKKVRRKVRDNCSNCKSARQCVFRAVRQYDQTVPNDTFFDYLSLHKDVATVAFFPFSFSRFFGFSSCDGGRAYTIQTIVARELVLRGRRTEQK